MKNIQIKVILSAIILLSTISLVGITSAASTSLYVFPASLTKTAGSIFSASVGVTTAGNKVCVIEGTLVFNNLSCQSITLSGDVTPQSMPTCSNPYFLLGVPGCSTIDKVLFTTSVKAGSAATASISFTGVDIIGEGVSVASASLSGNYAITPVCSCSTWGVWQNGTCGGDNCSAGQRFQTRTRICTPSGCQVNDGSRCIVDSACIAPSQVAEVSEPLVQEEVATSPIEEVTPTPIVAVIPPVSVAQASLLTIITNVLSLGTGKIWLAVIILILIIAIIATLFLIGKKSRKKV